MTKRADVATITVAVFAAASAFMFIASIVGTPANINRNVVATCIRDGGSESVCKQKPDLMTTTEKKEYIRDTVAHPQPMNEPLGG